MADKTKAELQSELKATLKALTKAEKVIDKCKSEAETGVGVAQSTIDDLNATISRLRAERNDWRSAAGGVPGQRGPSGNETVAAAPHGDHVCPKSEKALSGDTDVYSTERRLRAERDDWRYFSGGEHGMRGSSALGAVQADRVHIEPTEKVEAQDFAGDIAAMFEGGKPAYGTLLGRIIVGVADALDDLN